MGRIRLAAAAAIGDPVTVKALRERNQRPGERPLRSGPRARRGHQEARARGSCAAWSANHEGPQRWRLEAGPARPRLERPSVAAAV